MLSELDETLLHQTPDPFGEVGTSDHRFFDRNWFGCYSPDGRVGVITGMGAYANMNVLDGFASLQLDGRQHNVRASRQLRPAVGHLEVGPLRHEVVEPLKVHRLVLEPGDHGIAFDLRWEGVLAPHVEPRHQGRLDGRVFEDYTRFDQAGQVRGWVQVDDERIVADGWFGARDHSWGVRRSVGGFEPFTGSLPGELTDGVLFLWMEFVAGGFGGHVQLHEDGAGNRRSLEGFIAWSAADGRPPVPIVDVVHDLELHPGTRRYRRAHLVLIGADGGRWEVEADALLTAWAYRGTGYDGGFNDGQGLGAFRGEVVEHDVYDVSHPEDVVLPDGSTVRPLHREQGARITVNGVPGFAHLPVFLIGPNQRYGGG